MSKEYLGDGVYAQAQSGMIKLTTDCGDGRTNVVFLEPNVFAALKEYAQRLWSPVEADRASDQLTGEQQHG